MLHPVGRLPESTYWRRRTAVVVALVLTVVLVKSVLLSGGNSDAATRPTGNSAAASAGPSPTQTSPSPVASPSPVSASPSPSPHPTAVESKPSRSAARPKAAAAKPARSVVSRPVPTCDSRSLMLFVGSARDFYRVGQISDLTLTVANVSETACRGEIGPKVQEALVYKGKHRLWSSSDCYPGSESDVVTLRPGDLRRLVIRWSGDSSKPGCAGKRARIGAGTYTVVGKVGKLQKSGVLVLRR